MNGDGVHLPTAPARAPAPVAFADAPALHSAIVAEGESTDARLVILRAAANRGFAAGCNLGMRFLTASAPLDRLLLLNPDALLANGAFGEFERRLKDPSAGLCGASVLRFDAPHTAQAFGGARMRGWSLQGENIAAGRKLADKPARSVVEEQMDYPLGAAMALRADYRDVAGDLDERFFLYFEEVDWARRGGPARRPVWAPSAVVYHRHGASAGSRQRSGLRGAFSDYHMARSRMLYALKWRPILTPLIFVLTLVQGLRRTLRGQRQQSQAVLSAAFARRWALRA